MESRFRNKLGRVIRAPENYLDQALIRDISVEGINDQRRGFIKKSFLAAVGVVTADRAFSAPDPAIVNLPEHSKTLGKPVASRPYGAPSIYETSLQRRESPGLTRVSAASVSFAPLQSLLELSRRVGCTSSGIIKVGTKLIPPNID